MPVFIEGISSDLLLELLSVVEQCTNQVKKNITEKIVEDRVIHYSFKMFIENRNETINF